MANHRPLSSLTAVMVGQAGRPAFLTFLLRAPAIESAIPPAISFPAEAMVRPRSLSLVCTPIFTYCQLPHAVASRFGNQHDQDAIPEHSPGADHAK